MFEQLLDGLTLFLSTLKIILTVQLYNRKYVGTVLQSSLNMQEHPADSWIGGHTLFVAVGCLVRSKMT
ncbi:MAG: Uncharacterised protein [Flavobacteriales bacterium UBA4585]|nr:MAG: Uncharacterised protein [Flavobacteriales bacterium UBA4585]